MKRGISVIKSELDIVRRLVEKFTKFLDLYVDLRDGKMLLKLLEVLSGERLVMLMLF